MSKRLMPDSLKTFLRDNPTCIKADCFQVTLPVTSGGSGGGGGLSGLSGPYAAWGESNHNNGVFDQDTRTLYWVSKGTNQGSGNWRVEVSVLTPDGLLTIVVCAMGLGTSIGAGDPDGRLLRNPSDGSLYLGAWSSYGYYSWYRFSHKGDAEGNTGGMSFGGGPLGIADCACLDSSGNILHCSGATVTVVDTGSMTVGASASLTYQAVRVRQGAPGDAWALCSDGTTTAINKITAGPAVASFSLGTPGVTTSDIEYCSDGSVLFWWNGLLNKWDTTAHAVTVSVASAYNGSGPINEGTIPNGLTFYDTTTLALLSITGNGAGLPTYGSGGYWSKLYDADGSYIWLVADDGNVYGVPVAAPGGGGGGVGGGGAVLLCATEGQWDITIPEGTPGWSGGTTTFKARDFGVWGRGAITSEASAKCNSNTMALTVTVTKPGINYPGLDIGILSAIRNHLFDGATVWVFTVYMPFDSFGDVSAGVETKYQGTLTKVNKLTRDQAQFDCADPLYLLNMNVPGRLLQSNCPWSFCDDNCTLLEKDYTVPVTADVTSTQYSLVAAGGLTQADGYFAQGVVTCLTGANAGLSQTVKSQVGGTLALAYPWILPVTAGDTFSVIKGCDKTLAMCKATVKPDGSVVDNSAHQGGTPFVPAPTTSV